MDLLDLIRRRRSQRVDFLDRPITTDHVDRLVEAARWAPSPFNIQPWQLLFVTDAHRKSALGALTRECIVDQFKDAEFLKAVAAWTRVERDEWERLGDGLLLGDQLPESSFVRALAPLLMQHPGAASVLGKLGAGNAPGRATERMLSDTPLICVVWQDTSRRSPGNSGATWSLLSLGAMFQNLLLAATELGIASQFVNAALERAQDRDRVRELFRAPSSCDPVLILRLGYSSAAATTSVRRPPMQIVRWEEFGEDDA